MEVLNLEETWLCSARSFCLYCIKWCFFFYKLFTYLAKPPTLIRLILGIWSAVYSSWFSNNVLSGPSEGGTLEQVLFAPRPQHPPPPPSCPSSSTPTTTRGAGSSSSQPGSQPASTRSSFSESIESELTDTTPILNRHDGAPRLPSQGFIKEKTGITTPSYGEILLQRRLRERESKQRERRARKREEEYIKRGREKQTECIVRERNRETMYPS